MAEKKLLTYEGLEEYNIKWHERLQAMAIDIDAIDNIFENMKESDVWKFTVNTELVQLVDFNNIGAIPFYLHSKYNDVTLEVDWGDGETSILTKDDYRPWYFYGSTSDAINHSDQGDTEDLDTEASLHYYETPGIYTIRVKSSDWSCMYLLNMDDDAEIDIESGYRNSAWIWRRTLVSFDNAVPQMKGIMHYETTGMYPDECWVENGFNISSIEDLPYDAEYTSMLW